MIFSNLTNPQFVDSLASLISASKLANSFLSSIIYCNTLPDADDINCYGLNCVPQKETLQSLSLVVTVNVTLFRNRVFADIIRLR